MSFIWDARIFGFTLNSCFFYQRVRIHFVEFMLQMDEECIYDALRIYDGSSTSAIRLRALCGSTLPGDVVSSGNTLHANFLTNNRDTYSGFMLQYTTIDGMFNIFFDNST